MVKHTDETLLADVWRVAGIVGGIPSAQDYREYGNNAITTLYDRFGSWLDARKAAGIDGELDYGAPLKIDRRKVLQDIRGLYRWLGRVPTIDDYKRWGRYSQKPFYTQFDGWVDARHEAGVFDRSLVDVTKQDLIERLQWLYEKLGREPKIREYKEHVRQNEDIFYKFGGFEALKKEAGVWEGGYGNESRRWSREEMLTDIREKNELVDGVITVDQYKELGDISELTVWKEFGSFVKAREAAGIHEGSLLTRTGEDHPNFRGHDRSIYKTKSFRKNRQIVWERDGACVECGLPQVDHIEVYGRRLHCHHIIPARFGVRDGEVCDESVNTAANMVALCEDCHPTWDDLFVDLRKVGEG